MNAGVFRTQINTCWRILCELELNGSRENFPKSPSNPAATFRGLAYEEVWKLCLKSFYYDFVLSDNALLRFICTSFNPLEVSYSYLECPFDAPTYKGFLFEMFGNQITKKDIAEIGDSYRIEYEAHLQSVAAKSHVFPIRYDLDPARYREGHHPAGHFHFGFNTSIRLSTRKKLRPVSFLLFVIRQMYLGSWNALLSDNRNNALFGNVRDALDDIDPVHFSGLDMREMHLN